MKNLTYLFMALCSLAALSATASYEPLALEEQQMARRPDISTASEIQNVLSRYDELSRAIDKTQDKLSYPEAHSLWREYRWNTLGIHCLIDDYRNKNAEFADHAEADNRFSIHLPRIKDALSKGEEILSRYEQKLGQKTAQSGQTFTPGISRGYNRYGSGRGNGPQMGRGTGHQRWQEQN